MFFCWTCATLILKKTLMVGLSFSCSREIGNRRTVKENQVCEQAHNKHMRNHNGKCVFWGIFETWHQGSPEGSPKRVQIKFKSMQNQREIGSGVLGGPGKDQNPLFNDSVTIWEWFGSGFAVVWVQRTALPNAWKTLCRTGLLSQIILNKSQRHTAAAEGAKHSTMEIVVLFHPH